MTEGERELYEELRKLYWQWKEYGYNANRFIQKLEKDGPVATAEDLILKPGTSRGFQELQARGLLHLTVEATVLRDEHQALVDEKVLTAAKARLNNAGYSFD